MRARIHRGAAEIGGSCVELEADGRTLLLDAGLPLDENDAGSARLPAIAESGGPGLLAALLTHSHPDHFGLAERIGSDIPIYMGRDAAEILRAASFYTGREAPRASGELRDGVEIELGPFRVTPLLVDHSAYDAYALLVEADGHRLLYSGDLRAHGRKPCTLDRLAARTSGKVDTLLLEGTSFGREPAPGVPTSEAEVEERLVASFAATPGAALACFSPQNVDRLVSGYRAALRSGRDLVMDLYSADVAAATGRATIPQWDWDRVRVFVPNAQRIRVKRSGEFWRVDERRAKRIFSEELAADPGRYVVVFRASMASELERAGCLRDAGAVWSMWPGYLDQPGDRTRATFTRLGIELELIHASGHASVADLARLARAIAASRVVPIHTAHAEPFASVFENVERHGDGEWFDV